MLRGKMKSYWQEWVNGLFLLWPIAAVLFSSLFGPIVIGTLLLIAIYGINGSGQDADMRYLWAFIAVLSPIFLNRFSTDVQPEITKAAERAEKIKKEREGQKNIQNTMPDLERIAEDFIAQNSEEAYPTVIYPISFLTHPKDVIEMALCTRLVQHRNDIEKSAAYQGFLIQLQYYVDGTDEALTPLGLEVHEFANLQNIEKHEKMRKIAANDKTIERRKTYNALHAGVIEEQSRVMNEIETILNLDQE